MFSLFFGELTGVCIGEGLGDGMGDEFSDEGLVTGPFLSVVIWMFPGLMI